MKKNKTITILIIISILIFGIAVFSWISSALLAWNQGYIYSYNSILIGVGIPIFILNIIPLIWTVYMIVFLYRNKKKNELKFKHIIASIIIFGLTIMSIMYLVSLINKKHIEYKNAFNTYHIYQVRNKIELYYDVSVECYQEPCRDIRAHKTIDFSNEKMVILNNFIKEVFKNKKANHIQIFDKDLSNEQMRILKSIIYNDDKYLQASENKELYFSLQSFMIKCPTILLKVYKDNTYEYINGEDVTIERYDYDVSEIIDAYSNYDGDNNRLLYQLMLNDGRIINIYENKQELSKFLSLYNINLNVCANHVITD